MAELDQLRQTEVDRRASEQEAHQAQMESGRAELDGDRKAIATLREAAEKDAAEASRIKADLQRRIKLVTEAA